MLAALCSCSRLAPQNARLIYKNSNGSRDTVTMQMKVTGDHLSLHFTKEELATVDTLCILPEFANATAGEEGCKINAEFTYQTGAYAGLFIGSSDAGKTYTLGTTEKPCQVVSGSKVGSTTVTALDDATDGAGVLVGRKNAVTVNAANTSVITE